MASRGHSISSACKQHPEMEVWLLRVMPLAIHMQTLAANKLKIHRVEVPPVGGRAATLKAAISSITFLLKCQIV